MRSPRASRLGTIAAALLLLCAPAARAQFYWSKGIPPADTERLETGKLVFGEYHDEQKRHSRDATSAELVRMERDLPQRGADPAFLDEYAVVLFLNGRDKDAERVWLDLLRTHPEHATAWFNLASARQIRGRYDEARDAQLRGIAAKPGYRSGAEELRLRMLDFLIACRANPQHAREHLFLDELTPAWKARRQPPNTFASVKLTTAPVDAAMELMRGFHQFGDGWVVLGMLLENRGDLRYAKVAYQNAMKFGNGQAAELRPYLTALAQYEADTSKVRFTGRNFLYTLVVVIVLAAAYKAYRLARAMKEDREEARKWREEQDRLKKNANSRRYHGGPG
jgi:tetratricopeptide (TPR) repeat protein